MEWLTRNAIAAFLLPPGSLLLLLLCGLALMRKRRALGRACITIAVFALYALSTPFVADSLLQGLEPSPTDLAKHQPGDAIVVLGAGTYFHAPEYGNTTVNGQALVRLRYAARLYRMIGKPVLVTGGSPEGASKGEAVYMQETLERDFHVPVKWVEERSRTTAENARLSRAMLQQHGIQKIYLVTHAWHMPRARLVFEHAGFEVIPTPTAYATRYRVTLLDFLPDARALRDSSIFFHEAIGIAWYRIQFALARWLETA
jgi:uncharacterized SAM-binding protein YcdF (DUF218 family)